MTDSDNPAPARRRRPLRRTPAVRALRAVAALAIVLLLGSWAVLETDTAAERLRLLLQQQVTRSLRTPVSIGSLQLDVLPFRLELTDVSVPGADPEHPRARLRRLLLEISPWGLLRRRVLISNLELDRPDLDLALFARRGTGPRLPLRLAFRRVRVRDGSVHLRSVTARFDGELHDVSVELAPEVQGLLSGVAGSVGRLRVGGGRIDLSARNGAGAVLEPVSMDAAFGLNGNVLQLDDLRLNLGDSVLRSRGTMRGIGNGDLELQGDIALQDLFRLWVPPGPADHGGRARFRGTLEVRDGAPVLSGRLTAVDARMSGVPIERFSSDLQLHRELVALRHVRGRAYGGQIEGELVVDRSVSPARVQIQYSASGIDAAALSAWSVLPGWRASGRLGGAGTLSWSHPFRSSASGRGHLEVSVADVGSVAAAVGRVVAASSGLPMHRDPGRERHPVPSLPIPMQARLQYRLSGGNLAIQTLALQLPHTRIDVNGRLDLDGPVLLGARIQSEDLRMLDHLVSQYRAFREAEPGETRIGLRGSGRAELRVNGTVQAPILTGTVQADRLATRNLQIGALSAQLATRADGFVQAQQLQIRRRDGFASGLARVRLPTTPPRADGDEYDLELMLHRYAFQGEAEVLGGTRPVTGRLAGTLQVSGPLGGLRQAQFDLTLSGGRVSNVPVLSARARGTVNGAGWHLEQLAAQLLGGRVRASGDASRWSAQLEGIDLAELAAALPLQQPLAGRLTASISSNGTPPHLQGTAQGRWTDAVLDRLHLGEVVAAARAEDGSAGLRIVGGARPDTPVPTPPATVDEVSQAGAVPEDAWWAGLRIEQGTPNRFLLDTQASAPLLARLFAPWLSEHTAGGRLAGTLRAVLRGELGSPDSWQGTGRLSQFELSRGPFRATAEIVALTLQHQRLQVAGDLVSIGEPLAVDLQLGLTDGFLKGSLRGSLDLAGMTLLEPALQTAGTARGEVRLGGTLQRPTARGSVAVRGLSIDGGWAYSIRDVEADLELLGDRVGLERLEGTSAGAAFHVSGSVPFRGLAGDPQADPVRLRGRIDALPLVPLLSRSSAVKALVTGGSVSAGVQLQGRGSDWHAYDGALQIRALQLRLRDYQVALSGPVQARLQQGTVLLPQDVLLRGGRTALHLAGQVRLAPLQLDLHARGPVGFEPLNVLSPYWGTGGIADVDLRIAGTVPDLGYFGTADLREVVISPPPLRQPIEDIRARLLFENRRVRVQQVQGVLGGGRVTASGELFLRNSVPQSFRFAIGVQNALLRIERSVQVEVSAQLVHDGTPDHSLLSGRIDLVQGLYRRTLEADDAILEMFEAPETEADPLLAAVDLDIHVNGDRNLFIDNNLADIEVTADFDLRGTLAQPVVLGRSRLLGGRLFWHGNTFEVMQGAVEFNNPFRTEPVFQIRARTEIRRYTIDLSFSGSLQRGVAFSYTSTPSLSDLDLFNLLAFGEEPNSAVLSDPLNYQRALGLQATRYLADAYLSEVERGAQRVFGVDRFRVSPTLTGSETDATARLTVGKRINRNLYVTYSRLLSTSEDQLLTVEYQLSPQIRVKGTRDENGSFGIDFLVQKRIR